MYARDLIEVLTTAIKTYGDHEVRVRVMSNTDEENDIALSTEVVLVVDHKFDYICVKELTE